MLVVPSLVVPQVRSEDPSPIANSSVRDALLV